MAIFAENTATTSTPAPEGNHAARCVSMLDLGTQKNRFDETKPAQRKVQLVFELPDEMREDGKPFLLRQKFTLTMHEKGSLRKFLQAWRGKPFTEEEAKRFDVTVLLGKPCMLNVLHEQKAEKTYANIASVATLPKGMIVPAQITPTLEFSLDAASYDPLVFEQLADYVKDEIRESPEYKALQQPATSLAAASNAPDDSDLPF